MNKLLQAVKKPDLVFKRLYQILFNLVGFLPVKHNLIIFESFLGKQYSDSPRAIYEYLKEKQPEYKLLWSVDKRYKKDFEQLDIPFVYRFSIKWLFLMPRANYWVINSRMPYWIRKPNHTIYLQTWHGTPLKKLAGDMEEVYMPGTSTEAYKESFYKEAQNWDFLVSPNAYSTAIFKRAFHYKHEMIESGYPRNDFLFTHNNHETINRIRASLGIEKNKKVILYAPTWRDNEYFAQGKYKFTLKIDLEQLQSNLGKDYVILLRLHYLIANRIDVSQYKGFVIDTSNYDDIRELYLISDLLITDYSSVFFDYLCLKRPIIFYTYDIDSYRDKLRGFYFDFEKNAPGPLVKTTDDLIRTILQLRLMNNKQVEAITKFHNQFCYLEKGISTERVVNRVFLERARK